MTIWIVRKHPPHPFRSKDHLQAFTIYSVHRSSAEAKLAAKEKTEKSKHFSRYLYTVGRLTLKEQA